VTCGDAKVAMQVPAAITSTVVARKRTSSGRGIMPVTTLAARGRLRRAMNAR
jgi:hypothetical protein